MKPVSDQQIQGRTPQGRFAKGFAHNPKGKPVGARNKATEAAQALLDGEAQTLTRKAVELALEGDTTALRLCLERLLPPRKERALPAIKLPVVEGAADLPKVTASILTAVASGSITPSEGQSLAALVGHHGKALKLSELEQRLTRLEETLTSGRTKQ